MMSQLGSTSHHLTPYLQIEHEETCEYRPYQCPCPGASCKWQGSLEQVITPVHLTHFIRKLYLKPN